MFWDNHTYYKFCLWQLSLHSRSLASYSSLESLLEANGKKKILPVGTKICLITPSTHLIIKLIFTSLSILNYSLLGFCSNYMYLQLDRRYTSLIYSVSCKICIYTPFPFLFVPWEDIIFSWGQVLQSTMKSPKQGAVKLKGRYVWH